MSSKIRINVTDEDGVLLDTVEFDREEFIAAQASTTGSWAILSSLEIGKEDS